VPRPSSGRWPIPKGADKCALCTNFKPPDSCGIVDGKINPNGWCRFYTKK
jgi:hypothetical protein